MSLFRFWFLFIYWLHSFRSKLKLIFFLVIPNWPFEEARQEVVRILLLLATISLPFLYSPYLTYPPRPSSSHGANAERNIILMCYFHLFLSIFARFNIGTATQNTCSTENLQRKSVSNICIIFSRYVNKKLDANIKIHTIYMICFHCNFFRHTSRRQT